MFSLGRTRDGKHIPVIFIHGHDKLAWKTHNHRQGASKNKRYCLVWKMASKHKEQLQLSAPDHRLDAVSMASFSSVCNWAVAFSP